MARSAIALNEIVKLTDPETSDLVRECDSWARPYDLHAEKNTAALPRLGVITEFVTTASGRYTTCCTLTQALMPKLLHNSSHGRCTVRNVLHLYFYAHCKNRTHV